MRTAFLISILLLITCVIVSMSVQPNSVGQAKSTLDQWLKACNACRWSFWRPKPPRRPLGSCCRPTAYPATALWTWVGLRPPWASPQLELCDASPKLSMVLEGAGPIMGQPSACNLTEHYASILCTGMRRLRPQGSFQLKNPQVLPDGANPQQHPECKWPAPSLQPEGVPSICALDRNAVAAVMGQLFRSGATVRAT